jgi:hypothetical protein
MKIVHGHEMTSQCGNFFNAFEISTYLAGLGERSARLERSEMIAPPRTGSSLQLLSNRTVPAKQTNLSTVDEGKLNP